MSAPSSVSQPCNNALCRALGHHWEPTPAPNFRRCCRSRCQAAERWQEGRWVEIVQVARSKPHTSPEEASGWWEVSA